jgi:hypothetical protein
MILLVPSLVFGANGFGVAMTSCDKEAGKMVVSVMVTNDRPLTCLDVPLRIAGATVEKVSFEGTRVDYFDFKSSYIKGQDLFIGLIAQFSTEAKPQLAAGEGEICQLHLLMDKSASEVTISEAKTTEPFHALTYVERVDGRAKAIYPDFRSTTLSLTAKVPNDFGLAQNYPNPFNPSTTISFSVKEPCQVQVNIFNVLGQTVTCLVDEYLEAGTYDREWNADNFSSGVYFYQFKAKNFTETKKMVLMK